jgi:hypothetical protein
MNGRVVRRGNRVVGNCLAPETAPLLEGAGLVISGHADDGTIEVALSARSIVVWAALVALAAASSVAYRGLERVVNDRDGVAGAGPSGDQPESDRRAALQT